MSLTNILVNLLIAFLAFFVVRLIGGMVTPDGQDQDKEKVVTIVAVLVAILVFVANLASRVTL